MYLHALHKAVSRLLPTEGLVATGSYNLLMGEQNLKQGA